MPRFPRCKDYTPLLERMDRMYTCNLETGCWDWMAWRDRKGYGGINISGRCRSAHRSYYEAKVGTIPDGKFLCHHCDNPGCVNPTHMFIGTNLDNVRDMHKKGRGAVQVPRLSSGDVKTIKRDASGLTQAQLAVRYGVSSTIISRVLNNKYRRI